MAVSNVEPFLPLAAILEWLKWYGYLRTRVQANVDASMGCGDQLNLWMRT